MRIAVTGASGLIGSALVPHLRTAGHDVWRLVRRPATAQDEIAWDPTRNEVDRSALRGVDAVVHLAGAGVGDHRWTYRYRQAIRDSRVDGTQAIARAVAALDPPPRVLVSASAVGFYGDTGSRPVDERSPGGTGFLAEVVRAWEAAAWPAASAGIRVVHPRSGLVVAAHGGAWGRMWPLFEAGLGGRFGSGRQYWSWISLRDEVRALTRLITDESLSGPVNLTGPTPATNAEVTASMARVLHRPARLAVPALALRAALGDLSSEVLGSIRAMPSALTAAGFTFCDASIHDAIRTAAAGRRARRV